MYSASFVFAAMAIVAVVALLGGLAIGRPWGRKDGLKAAFEGMLPENLPQRCHMTVSAIYDGGEKALLREVESGVYWVANLAWPTVHNDVVRNGNVVQVYQGARVHEFYLVDPSTVRVTSQSTI